MEVDSAPSSTTDPALLVSPPVREMTNIKLETANSMETDPSSSSRGPEEAEENLESKEEEEPVEEAKNVYVEMLAGNGKEPRKGKEARMLTTPVVAPHSSVSPPFSSLSVYDAVVSDTLPLIAMYRSFSRHSGSIYGTRRRTRNTTPAFFIREPTELWRPVTAPPSSLIDQSLPNTSEEWSKLSQKPVIPHISTILDPASLLGGSGSVLVNWQSIITTTKKIKPVRPLKAPTPPPATQVEEAEEIESVSSASSSSRYPPRHAKKRARELTVGMDNLEDESDASDKKKRKEITNSEDFVLRLPIGQHLRWMNEVMSRVKGEPMGAANEQKSTEQTDYFRAFKLVHSSSASNQ